MIFEKLEYAVRAIEKDKERLTREEDLQGDEELDRVHAVQMLKFDRTIKEIKSLFKNKLEDYDR